MTRFRWVALTLATGLLLTSSIAVADRRTSGSLPGALPFQLPGSIDLGPAPSEEQQRIDLVLNPRDATGLDQLALRQQDPASPDYRRWLTAQEYESRFAPGPAAVRQVRDWARSEGLVVDRVSGTTLVSVSGTRQRLGAAFGVRLRSARLSDGTRYVSPDRPGTVPVALHRITAAVVGLTTYNANRTFASPARQGYQPYGVASYTPQDFAEIYRAPTSAQGTGKDVAILTDGDLRQVARDLTTFQKRFKLRRVPLTVRQYGPRSSSTENAVEYDLDTQWAMAFAPQLRRLYAYNAAGLGSLWAISGVVTDRRVFTISGSFGGCEVINARLGYVSAADQFFRRGMVQGQTFWFSSGDDGSSCFTPEDDPLGSGVSYPASSRFVVAVGGTSLTGTPAQPVREIGWTGSGGGVSVIQSAPPWQRSALLYEPASGRGVPDVSLDADPNSGYTVIVDGQVETIGGTSASAPAWNGIWARVLQKHPKIGFAAPALYRARAGAFVDITVGSNGLFPVTPGYDLVTGLGTPDMTQLVALIR